MDSKKKSRLVTDQELYREVERELRKAEIWLRVGIAFGVLALAIKIGLWVLK